MLRWGGRGFVAIVCTDCKWFVAEDMQRGECHRYAPAPNAAQRDPRARIFPVVSVTDGCGDHELKECA